MVRLGRAAAAGADAERLQPAPERAQVPGRVTSGRGGASSAGLRTSLGLIYLAKFGSM